MIKRVNKVLKITPEQLIEKSRCFAPDVTTQEEVITRLYSYVLGEEVWNGAEKLHGSPEVSPGFWKYICKKFMDFDHRVTNPRMRKEGGERRVVLTGGAWMNSGFSVDERMDSDTVKMQFDYTAVDPIRQQLKLVSNALDSSVKGGECVEEH